MRTLLSIIKLLRPEQWLKNLLLLFPPFFAGKLSDPTVGSAILPAVLSFSLAASCGYIINDIRDRSADKNHATKKDRALAKGDLSVVFAIILAVILYVSALIIASNYVSRRYELFLLLYLFISVIYTLFLKDIILFDIFFICFGFLVRVMAGGEAFRVSVSNWLFLTVFLVALFLASGKRLAELISLGDAAQHHRKIFIRYTQSYLEGILWFSASASLVTYSLYTIDHRNSLFYTVPLAAFGLLRYVYIVKEGKGDPTQSLLTDAQIMGVGIIWILMIAVIIY